MSVISIQCSPKSSELFREIALHLKRMEDNINNFKILINTEDGKTLKEFNCKNDDSFLIGAITIK